MKKSTGADFTIRAAAIKDLEMIVKIYNHYIENTAITFETRPFKVNERKTWFDQFKPTGPYRLLVMETRTGITGYCSSSRFKERPAYRTSVETCIYLDPNKVGHGLGSPLYSALLKELEKEISLHRAYAGISLPNRASEELHLKLGFKQAGLYREVGYKFDRYWDVAMYERNLDIN